MLSMPRVPRNKPASTRNTPSRRAWRLLSTACNVQAGSSVAASRQLVIAFVSLPLNFLRVRLRSWAFIWWAAGPEDDAQQLRQVMLLLKRRHCLNISRSCRVTIAEKLERLEAIKLRLLLSAYLMLRRRCCWRCRRGIRHLRICSSC
jgi:hypothetical protein